MQPQAFPELFCLVLKPVIIFFSEFILRMLQSPANSVVNNEPGVPMKYLLFLSLIVSGVAYAGNEPGTNPTCDELGKTEISRLTKLANKYFWKEIAAFIKQDDDLTLVYGSFEGADYSDCHDYDNEFDNMVFTLEWQQKTGEAVQQCSIEVSVNYHDEVQADDNARCEEL